MILRARLKQLVHFCISLLFVRFPWKKHPSFDCARFRNLIIASLERFKRLQVSFRHKNGFSLFGKLSFGDYSTLAKILSFSRTGAFLEISSGVISKIRNGNVLRGTAYQNFTFVYRLFTEIFGWCAILGKLRKRDAFGFCRRCGASSYKFIGGVKFSEFWFFASDWKSKSEKDFEFLFTMRTRERLFRRFMTPFQQYRFGFDF